MTTTYILFNKFVFGNTDLEFLFFSKTLSQSCRKIKIYYLLLNTEKTTENQAWDATFNPKNNFKISVRCSDKAVHQNGSLQGLNKQTKKPQLACDDELWADLNGVWEKMDRVIMTPYCILQRWCGYNESLLFLFISTFHDDVIQWKHFARYWPFVGVGAKRPVMGALPHPP